MTEETMGLIAVIKGWGWNHLNTDERIAEYLRQYRNTKFRFDHDTITNEMRKAVVDYLSTCDDPQREIRRYFLDRSALMPEKNNDWDQLRYFLGGIQVRENGNYINGFTDISLWHEDEENEIGN